MKSVHGIAITDDERYVMASLSLRAAGWRVTGMRTWNSRNRLRCALLLAKGVTLGLPSFWRRRLSSEEASQMIAGKGDDAVLPYALPAQHSAHTENLSGNLLATVSDDSFLAAIPLSCAAKCPPDFVSVCRSGDVCRIGLIIAGKLVSAFILTPADDAAVQGHLARIERYRRLQNPDGGFPAQVFVLGEPVGGLSAFASVISLKPDGLGAGQGDPARLKAVGAALSPACGNPAPLFSGASPRASRRMFNAAMFVCALALMCGAVAGVAGLWTANTLLSRAIIEQRDRYQSIVNRNADIRTMADTNTALAQRITRLNQTFSRQTQWALFMQKLGAMKPSGLYIEQLGTEPVTGGDSRMRVALAGWAASDDLVTDFMSQLQNEPLLGDISLSSIEHRSGGSGKCQFRIFFVLKITRT